MTVKDYAKEIFGEVHLEDVVVELPLYLRRFKLCKMMLLNRWYAIASVDDDTLDVDGYQAAKTKLEHVLGAEIVFCFDKLTSLKRNTFIKKNIPFIVAGKQFFLPPYLRLEESVVRKKSERLSPSAQALIIRQLVCGDIDGCAADEISKLTGISNVTIHAAVQDIADKKLAVLTSSWPKRIKFEMKGRNLWDAALPMMKSPVVKTIYNSMSGLDGWIKAGESAMAKWTMLSPDKLPVYACMRGAQNGLNQLAVAENRYEARSILQVWSYRPDICHEGEVDKLSLYLSMRGEEDPRVQSELERLIGGMEWK